jgi:histidinol-phosphate/aromatic aminotransferase/cobyric acid decarboxylase-like protein
MPRRIGSSAGAAVVAGRERAIAALRQLPGLTVFDSAANFFLVRSQRDAGADAVPAPARRVRDPGARRLVERCGLEECLRISVGTDDDMEAVIAAMARDCTGRDRMSREATIERITGETEIRVRFE